MPTNTNLLELLEKIKIIHEKKSADYSSEGFYANFEQASQLTRLFKNTTHQVFASLIGVKISRIANLLNKQTEPNNESIDDSFLDLTTYCALFASYVKDNQEKNQPEIPIRLNEQIQGLGAMLCKHTNLDQEAKCFICKKYLSPSERAGKYRVLPDHRYVLDESLPTYP